MFIPAERHRQLFVGATVPHRPNYGKPPIDKPALKRQIGDLPPLGPATATDEATVLGRQRSLAAIDDGVGDILKALEEQGQLDNTVIVFTSDNGYFYGEHGLSVERRLAYEESARIPIVARFPKLIPAGSTPTQLVLNLDVAPTVLELAGVARPTGMEGRSLVPIFLEVGRAVARLVRDRVFLRHRVPPHLEDGLSGSAYGALEVHSLHGAAEHGRAVRPRRRSL